jgi:hypothetical protein
MPMALAASQTHATAWALTKAAARTATPAAGSPAPLRTHHTQVDRVAGSRIAPLAMTSGHSPVATARAPAPTSSNASW